MSSLLLAVSAAGVAVMLIGISYPSLSDYAEYRTGRAPYHPLADAEPLFEPHIVKPLVDRPDVWYYNFRNVFGYDHAVHNPKDDSVTITYVDGASGYTWPQGISDPSATELIHTQTYHVNSTFAYYCYDNDDHTMVYLYQYRGTEPFQGNLSLVFVHFEVKIPERVPCIFPDYLIHTVDVFAGDLDLPAGLNLYEPQETDSYNRTTYIDPIRHAVIISTIYVDPWPIDLSPSPIVTIMYNPDDSITVTHHNLNEDESVGNLNYTRTYSPGQTFLVSCVEHEDTAELYFYNYRGIVIPPWKDSPSILLVNFGAYTRAPMPCTFPDFIVHSVDALDTSRFDLQYDREWYKGS